MKIILFVPANVTSTFGTPCRVLPQEGNLIYGKRVGRQIGASSRFRFADQSASIVSFDLKFVVIRSVNSPVSPCRQFERSNARTSGIRQRNPLRMVEFEWNLLDAARHRDSKGTFYQPFRWLQLRLRLVYVVVVSCSYKCNSNSR